MTKVPTALPPCPTTPMTPLASNTSGSKKTQVFISQHDSLLNEPDFESTEEGLLDQDEFDSSPYSTFQSSFNPPEPQDLPRFFIPNQLREAFSEEAKKLITEDNKKVKVVNPKEHSTFGNP